MNIAPIAATTPSTLTHSLLHQARQIALSSAIDVYARAEALHATLLGRDKVTAAGATPHPAAPKRRHLPPVNTDRVLFVGATLSLGGLTTYLALENGRDFATALELGLYGSGVIFGTFALFRVIANTLSRS